MKIKATKRFSELGSGGNWAGFGKSKYINLEQGKTVEHDNVSDHLLEEGYVKEVKNTKKEAK